ncbi:MAG: FliM/FliN family flagellar motor switch protein [Sphingomonadaceae bacterium]|uniref:FliM/FliN family flagellar motor switch protein n=1 Tax=Thermaurantiacus sp. TaxID=2820283 RepID=UPI00298F32EE|nr:FliM/FliN family flagellar motor switch protein [Thermaurantiacus sp.]MCS6987005.1 FliM/FliN family flagellar motor switch protein [Sphingomonadaceae bacterium]MDW8415657.1 FliM/FliN family flagellar motor switch protein [Thermaurantiacus sp.]
MTDMSPGTLPPRNPARSKRPGASLEIELDTTVDPLTELAGEPAVASPVPDAPATPEDPAPAEPPPGTRRRPSERDPMAAARAAGLPPALARVEVTVAVEVGRRRMSLADILASEPGEIIPLDRLTDEPVDVLVNGRPFGRGEILALGDSFAVRLVSLVDPDGTP